MSVRLGLSPLSKALSMRRALHFNLLPSALALAVSLPIASYVQAQELEIDVPAQSLGSALQAFGRQANLQVLYSPTDVEGKRSNAVKGKLDPDRAITTLLQGTGSYTPGTIATATRLVLTPRETPQSISVVTRQAMDDFALSSIDDVMNYTPGITVSTYDSERTNYFSRGFSINTFQC